MSILLIIGIIIGTLVFALLFDLFFGLIFKSRPPKDSIEYLMELVEKINKKK